MEFWKFDSMTDLFCLFNHAGSFSRINEVDIRRGENSGSRFFEDGGGVHTDTSVDGPFVEIVFIGH